MYFIKTIKEFLTIGECDNILTYMSKSKLNEASFGTKENKRTDKKIRDSLISMVEMPNLQNKIGILLENELKFKGFTLNNVDSFQFTKYQKNGHYSWHTDSGIGNEDRFCSIVIQLNDEYEGGELMYKDVDDNEIEFEKGKGNMFIFSSNIQHCVRPVLNGDRYSLVSWVCLKKLENSKTLI